MPVAIALADDSLIVREGVVDSAAAEDVMRAHKIKKLPLVDAAGRLLGLVTEAVVAVRGLRR